MRTSLRCLVSGTALAAALPSGLLAQAKDLPLKYSGPPTKAEISAGDLMTRLYKFADDSMMGRSVGTEYNVKGAEYIAGEVKRLGLKAGGDDGSYFQKLPFAVRALDAASTITAGEQTLKAGVDFVAIGFGTPRQLSGARVIWGGTAFDTTNILSNEQIRGNVVIMRQFRGGLTQAFASSEGMKRYQASLAGASTMFVQSVDTLTTANVNNAMRPTNAMFLRGGEAVPGVTMSAKGAEMIFGKPLSELAKGDAGKPITTDIRYKDDPRDVGRNVVAILEGSDPKLKGQFVAMGAHNDHIGFARGRSFDHDSIKAYMSIVRPQGADSPPRPTTAEETARLATLIDSLRKAHGARVDSIFNGADDDGSGTVTVLELAEAFALAKSKPKRSILFVWHAGEEGGMLGSGLFTDNPPPGISRDSIVAQINLDMVGRGRATDVTGEASSGGLLHGGKGYLQLVGSRRLSTELGDLVEKVNQDEKLGFVFDYNIDANGHPQNIYCRSDHWSYAKWGIPVVFMTTGGHADYHQVTDEPQYIDYDHMAEVAKLVQSLAIRVANLDHRIVVDKPKPDPKGGCKQ